MTLQQLKYAVEIAGCGSITEAAKRLYISQPSLSNAIRELEQEIGISLFFRGAKGSVTTPEGLEFLGYARQILEQTSLLEERYLHTAPVRQRYSISTQHYAFAVDAFVKLIQETASDEYDFTLRETRTYEIIEDVKNHSSEIGILYLNDFNRNVLQKLLQENQLTFHPLFSAKPHVFIRKDHPLSAHTMVTFGDLEEYPYLSFEQGQVNSFYFTEEIQSTVYHKKSIQVSDRATLFNLLIGLNGYTISSGIMSVALNGDSIISVPLVVEDKMEIGYIDNAQTTLSKQGTCFIAALRQVIETYGITPHQ